MGKRALPQLFQMLHASDSSVKRKLVLFVNEYTAFQFPPGIAAKDQQRRAIIGLAALHMNAPKIVVQHLAQQLQEPGSSREVASILAMCGSEGLTSLLRALTNQSPAVRA